jgi:hypothetical protein
MRIKRLGTFLIAGGVFSLPLLGVGPASAASVPVVYIHEIQPGRAGRPGHYGQAERRVGAADQHDR